MAETTERVELELVKDWAQAPDGTATQLDLAEDAWEYGAPPPRGLYDLKLFPAKECVKWGLQDTKDKNSVYYFIQMECKVVSDNEDYNGIPVFGNVSTRIFRGKSISTAAGLLVKLSYKVPNPITDKNLAKLTEMALKNERIIKSELDWRGAYSYRDAKGQEVWENVFNHYEEFPLDPEKQGVRKHIVTVASKGGGVAEVRAQLRIVRFFGKDDKLPVIVSGTTLASAPKSVLQPPMQPHPYVLQQVLQPAVPQTPQQVQVPQMVQQPQIVQQPVVNAVPAPSPITGGELELLLET